MKKNVFILAASALLILSGLAFSACDDDDSASPPAVGNKTIDIRVIDETGTLTTADVSIKKDGTLISPFLVAGSYTLDVGKESNNTVFTFKATRNGYIASAEQSVTLTYSDPSDAFSSYVVLRITKQGSAITIDPTKDNTFTLPSSTMPGGQIQVSIPAGAVDRPITLNPTIVPTAGSRGQIEADSPNGSIALQIIDLQSDWTGNFLNGKMATFSFPLTQDIIDFTVKKGIPLVFGTNSGGTWQGFPVTVNESSRTGTVSIPHFSPWYLSPSFTVDISLSQSPLETLGTGDCGASLTVTFTKENAPVPEFYKRVFGWTSFPNVSQSNTEAGVDGKYWLVRGRSLQKTVTVEGTTEPIPDYTYYAEPVTFSSTSINCGHSGGGGQ